MAGTEQEKVRDLILQKFSKLGSNLEVILVTGSIASEEFSKNSDIDLILSFKQLDFETRAQTAAIITEMENITKKKVGANIVRTEEILQPLQPLTTLDGKTFQALIEVCVNKSMILFDPLTKTEKFYHPSTDEVKRHSINNIEFFKLRERKLSTHEYDKEEQVSLILNRKMRASFIVSKLAIQAITEQTVTNKLDIIDEIKKHIPILFEGGSVLIKNLDYKKGVANIKKEDLLAENDKYIEDLASYVIKFKN
jgi:predicted nucleotidyltransferase